MQKLLEAFAEGSLHIEPRFLKREDYRDNLQKTIDCKEKLIEALNEEEKKLLEDLLDAEADITGVSNIERFISGYRLGVLMTMEVFTREG